MKMTTEEAFVKVLQMHGIEHAFGIIGSAFMPISAGSEKNAARFLASACMSRFQLPVSGISILPV